METYKIFGIKIDNVSLDESLQKIAELVKSEGSHLVVTLGVEMVMRARRDPKFFNAVNSASLVVPDTVGILWACKRAGNPLKGQVAGIEILKESARKRDIYPWRVFFLGAKPGVAEAAAENLQKEFPGFRVVGTHHGYFKEDEEVLKKIEETSPDILFIALGSPTQENWFIKNRERLKNIVAIGVGGSFDVISGQIKRAPKIFRKLGLEWFYRLITQPSRAGRMLVLPAFALRVIFKGVN